MPTSDATTNNFESQLQASLHGQSVGASINDPMQYEVGLFTADPTDTASLTNELSTGIGYLRKTINMVAGTGADAGKLVNESAVTWNASDATGSATASWLGVFKKKEYTIPVDTTATSNNEGQYLWLPSLSVEDASTGTFTAVATNIAGDDFSPYYTGDTMRVTDSTASFPTTGVDGNMNAFYYVIITSGSMRGLKIPVWKTLSSTQLVLDVHGYDREALKLVNAEYILRKSPTWNSVFGPGTDNGDGTFDVTLTGGSSSTADKFYIYYGGPTAIVDNISIDTSARSVTFTSFGKEEASAEAVTRMQDTFSVSNLSSFTDQSGASATTATLYGLEFSDDKNATYPEGIKQLSAITLVSSELNGNFASGSGDTFTFGIAGTDYTMTEGVDFSGAQAVDAFGENVVSFLDGSTPSQKYEFGSRYDEANKTITIYVAREEALTAGSIYDEFACTASSTDSNVTVSVTTETTARNNTDVLPTSTTISGSEAKVAVDFGYDPGWQIAYHQQAPSFAGGDGYRSFGSASTDLTPTEWVLPIHDVHFGGSRRTHSESGGAAGGLYPGYGISGPNAPLLVMENESTGVVYHATQGLESELLWRAEITDPTSGSASPLTYSSTSNVQFAAGAIKFYVT